MRLKSLEAAPARVHERPRRPQDDAQRVPERLRRAQEGPKTAPRGSQRGSGGPKRGPRWPRDAPGRLQEGPPEGSKRRPRTNLTQRSLRDPSQNPLGPLPGGIWGPILATKRMPREGSKRGPKRAPRGDSESTLIQTSLQDPFETPLGPLLEGILGQIWATERARHSLNTRLAPRLPPRGCQDEVASKTTRKAPKGSLTAVPDEPREGNESR